MYILNRIYYSIAIWFSPDNFQLYLDFSGAHERKGELILAQELLERAIFERFLSNAWLFNNFAWYCFQILDDTENYDVDGDDLKNLLKRAYQYFQKAMELDPDEKKIKENWESFQSFCRKAGHSLEDIQKQLDDDPKISHLRDDQTNDEDEKPKEIEVGSLKISNIELSFSDLHERVFQCIVTSTADQSIYALHLEVYFSNEAGLELGVHHIFLNQVELEPGQSVAVYDKGGSLSSLGIDFSVPLVCHIDSVGYFFEKPETHKVV